jgi:beta-glucosidase
MMLSRFCYVGLAISAAVALPQSSSKGVFENPEAAPEARAADLVSRMTLEEKVSQMQNSAPAIPRLGIPAYDWWNEGLHGVARAGLATVFPQAIGLAATWDTALMFRIGTAISTEARGKYNDAIAHGNRGRYFGLTFWSPNINIFRDPRWGRGQETYGEDPYLTSRFGVAFVKGMQGDDPHYFKVIATAKHFAVHSGPEPSRHEFNVDVDPNDLRNTYLPAFQALVDEAHADSVMCAYNSVDGVPACASTMLLGDHLRRDWGFQGYVVSDCGAIGDIFKGHKYKPTMAAASASAVLAGTDLTCGNEYRSLTEAVKQGIIQEGAIDKSLTRLFVARLRLGMFDPPGRVPFSKLTMADVDTTAHRQLALEAARKSIVLLKNEEQALPLASSLKRIAVLGPTADDPDVLLGNYNGIPSRLITPLDGITKQFSAKASVDFALGSTYTPGWTALVSASVLTAGTERHGLQAEYFDNANLAGTPVVSRIDQHGYFVWDMHDPRVTPKLARDSFSIRWTGSLRVTQSGDYALGFTRLRCADCKGNDSAQLYVDDKLLVEDARHVSWQPQSKTSIAHLKAGSTYRIRLEYRQMRGAAGLEFVWIPPAEALLKEAAETIRRADVAIVCVGLNSDLEGEESKVNIPGFEGGDRTEIGLPEPEEKLLDVAFSLGKPVIVVLLNGSALAVTSAAQKANALLEAWYPGQDGGTAIAETLAGENNPSGRLPVTFYESVGQLPPFTDYSMRGRTYRYFTGAPLYPFGYGLSYSDFRYSDLSIEGNHVTVRVKNASSRDGDEVAQLYTTPAHSKDGLVRRLQGFERVHLKAGETRTLSFMLPADSGAAGKISVGGGQPIPGWSGIHYVEISR